MRLDQMQSGLKGGFIPPQQARALWGYGLGSSGGIQTEAALKQFGLLAIVGRGPDRALQPSELGLRLLNRSGLPAWDQHRLIEQAALTPQIHRELRARWPDHLPGPAARRFLIAERGFTDKGAADLIAEYERTIRFLDLMQTGAQPPEQAPAEESGGPNEIVVTDKGDRVLVSALVDRAGLRRLIEILQVKLAK